MRMSVAAARKAFPKADIPKAKRQPRAKSNGEETFWLQCKTEHIELPERELRFELGRKWQLDFAWQRLKVAVEIEGLRKSYIKGVPYALGRHCTFKGFEDDCIKYAHAAILGWFVLRFNQALVMNGTALKLTRLLLIERELHAHGVTVFGGTKLSELSVVGAAPRPVRAPKVMTPKEMGAWIGSP
jgi:very-short-patch-repair endonuclease